MTQFFDYVDDESANVWVILSNQDLNRWGLFYAGGAARMPRGAPTGLFAAAKEVRPAAKSARASRQQRRGQLERKAASTRRRRRRG